LQLAQLPFQLAFHVQLRHCQFQLSGQGFRKSEHLRNIKDEFAVVDGEIQAGNNNPQLMRDARKMLKEMVQQKLVTLYEAQSHMKHLRKIIKI
jgi:predicted kinase